MLVVLDSTRVVGEEAVERSLEEGAENSFSCMLKKEYCARSFTEDLAPGLPTKDLAYWDREPFVLDNPKKECDGHRQHSGYGIQLTTYTYMLYLTC